ncbi:MULTISPECIES: DEAD/DEAH box helicase [unclassified Paenibacillus]|uniref:DEAD/DEAH box helicase n=1 Tax=unclassified Paenibacillus TaxID=185978 RepID=UPI00041A847E|nr:MULTISPECIES: DEAD/DEAH box helicase [unclassified Paenibacillus]KGP80097.1 DEAD/DEAH box helicase [Paenibacillus sp. MAEPY2]KGP89402.1 DEAD/DEAH box helicase [Paenibacillus sp. MAEPY1]
MAAGALSVERKKFIPHDYQRYCINRLLTDDALGLFLDLGLGKTVITLTAVNDLKYNRFAVSRTLVIAPKKVAEATWGNEAAKWQHLKHMRIITVLGTAQQRIKSLNSPGDVWVINRDNVAWLVEYYRNAWPFDMVVLDELSSFKNHQAKRFKVLTWVRPHIKRIVGLTGTPAPNGLLDLWAQVNLLDQGQRLERNITGYRTKYFEKNYNGHGYMAKPGADDVIQRKIADLCISMKAEDYLELPDSIVNVIPVVLDAKAQKQYNQLEKELLLEIDEGTEITATSAAVLSGKLLQLCNGALYDENRQVFEIHDNKVEAFMELVEQLNGKSALVFYSFQHDLTRIKKALEKTSLRIRELKTPQDQLDWNAGKVDILLAHPASAAYGLNLQDGGNHVVWFGLNWSLELYQQANGRLHRQGQKQKVILHHLVVQGGADEDVMKALEGKAATQDKLLDALKARIERVK